METDATFITEFTPMLSAIGGVLIGISAVLLMAFLGRIAGATGILAGAILSQDRGWRIAMLAGMIAAPAALSAGLPLIKDNAQAVSFPVNVTVPTEMLVISGLIVGLGVTLGSGCTSGHGVCGMSRLSARSIVATLTFMATTAVTVFVLRHVAVI